MKRMSLIFVLIAIVIVAMSGTVRKPDAEIRYVTHTEFVPVVETVTQEVIVEREVIVPAAPEIKYVYVQPNVRVHSQWEWEGTFPIGDIVPHTRVDIIMDHDTDYAGKCDDWGGKLITQYDTQIICRGVDY